MISLEQANQIIKNQESIAEKEKEKKEDFISIDEAQNILNIKSAKEIEEDQEPEFIPAEQAGIKINASELLKKNADQDLIKSIQENTKRNQEQGIIPLEQANLEMNLMKGSILDGGEIQTPIEDIIKYQGYYSWENFKENLLKRTFLGAGRDLGQGTIDLTNYLGDKFFDERPFENVKLPKVAEPTWFGGSLSRDVLGFALPFLSFNKLATTANVVTKIPKATSLTGKIVQNSIKGAAVGGVAEQFAFSPYEGRLSNLIESFPSLANPITEYLSATDQDSEDKARFKMLIEGGLFGIPLDALFSFIGRGKRNGLKTTKIKNTDAPVENANYKRNKQAEKIESYTGAKPKSLEDKIDLNTSDRLDDISEKIIDKKISKKVEGFFEDLLIQGSVKRNPNIRISEQIYDTLTTPRIMQKVDLPKLLKKYNLKQEEIMDFFIEGARTSAQNLNRLSQLSKAYGKFLKDGKASDNLIKELDNQGVDTTTLLDSSMKRLDGLRRGAMVGRWSTAIRNFLSQTGRIGLNVLYEGFQYGADTLWSSLGGRNLTRKTNPLTAMQGFLNIFRQILPGRHKKVKADVDQILSYYPKLQDRLFLRYSSDVANTGALKNYSPLSIAEKGVHLLNFLNRFQEFITRRAVFLSSLDAIVRGNKNVYKGKTLNQIINDKKLIAQLRKDDIASAIDHSLEMTYAVEPKGGIGEAFVRFVNKVPFTLSLAIPFPRFLVNSLKFLYDYSPLPTVVGAGKAALDIPLAAMTFSADGTFTKSFFKKLKNGETEGMVKSLMGWGLMGTAMQIRDSKIAGEKWNEIKIGNKTIDVYPYNPLAAYLYVADFVDRWQQGTLGTITGKTKEIAKVFLGTRGGSGLYLVDQLLESISTGGGNKGYRIINELVGKVAAQYVTPFKTYMGFLDARDGNIQAAKDTKTSTLENAKFDPRVSIVNNLKAVFNPGELPDYTSITHAVQDENGNWVARPLKPEGINVAGYDIPGNVVTELTGAGIRQPKNPAEQELDRLNIQYSEIFRSTGIPVLDRAYKNQFAPMIHLGLSAVVESPGYQNLNVNMKRLVLKEFIKGARKDTMEALQKDASLVPYIMEYNVSKISKDQRKIIDDAIGKDYLNQLILEFQRAN